jgi:hypothetical protein
MNMMSNITRSASKIAFLALIGTACIAFLFEVAMGKAVLEAKDFMVLASGAAAFYFAYKGDTKTQVSEQKTDQPAASDLPFAGK